MNLGLGNKKIHSKNGQMFYKVRRAGIGKDADAWVVATEVTKVHGSLSRSAAARKTRRRNTETEALKDMSCSRVCEICFVFARIIIQTMPACN